MLRNQTLLMLLFFLLGNTSLIGQNASNSCHISLQGDTLVLENEFIERAYLWNNGNIMTLSIKNKETDHAWAMERVTPDLFIPGATDSPTNTRHRIYEVQNSHITPYHKCIEIIYSLGALEIKRVLRLYPKSSAIVADYYFRGQSNTSWTWDGDGNKKPDYKTKENLSHSVAINDIVSVENLHFSGRHWSLETVSLLDNTDRLNTLVTRNQYLSFSPRVYEGNLLFANNQQAGEGIFMLKEAPSPMAQLNYPGGDYVTEYGHFKMIGIGISDEMLSPEKWTRGYSSVVGVTGKGKSDHHKASLAYQMARKQYTPERDNLIMANTWGDGNRDSKINERFILDELEAASFYGITHYQLDDGWQQGLSEGSATRTENLKWDSWAPADWEPHKERFPNGFTNIIKSARNKGIELGLWFNPSKVNNFIAWETDADILINIYKKYGIKYFKIDGMILENKESEENFIRFLDKIKRGTEGNAIFNLDVTFNKRFGYLYYADYGTIFVENRYTYRGKTTPNYYPFWTLRNFWMLSRYVPAQKLQIEFPNKWNNKAFYLNDPFGPIHYDFEYLFAITMMSQPLAWFEPSNLPEEAKSLASVIKGYADHQKAIHEGTILPIGDEPSGKSWTGFQSLNENEGYLLIFREYHASNQARIETLLPASSKVKLTYVLGDGKDQIISTSENSEVDIELAKQNSFVLYRYELYK